MWTNEGFFNLLYNFILACKSIKTEVFRIGLLWCYANLHTTWFLLLCKAQFSDKDDLILQMRVRQRLDQWFSTGGSRTTPPDSSNNMKCQLNPTPYPQIWRTAFKLIISFAIQRSDDKGIKEGKFKLINSFASGFDMEWAKTSMYAKKKGNQIPEIWWCWKPEYSTFVKIETNCAVKEFRDNNELTLLNQGMKFIYFQSYHISTTIFWLKSKSKNVFFSKHP